MSALPQPKLPQRYIKKPNLPFLCTIPPTTRPPPNPRSKRTTFKALLAKLRPARLPGLLKRKRPVVVDGAELARQERAMVFEMQKRRLVNGCELARQERVMVLEIVERCEREAQRREAQMARREVERREAHTKRLEKAKRFERAVWWLENRQEGEDEEDEEEKEKRRMEAVRARAIANTVCGWNGMVWGWDGRGYTLDVRALGWLPESGD